MLPKVSPASLMSLLLAVVAISTGGHAAIDAKSAAVIDDAASFIKNQEAPANDQSNPEPSQQQPQQTEETVTTTVAAAAAEDIKSCENKLPEDQCANSAVCDSSDAETNCRQSCGLCSKSATKLEDVESETPMVSRAEVNRTYAIIGGSVAGFFLLLGVVTYWRRKVIEQQELDSECYYFEPEAHTWVQEMANTIGHGASFNTEPAEPEPLTIEPDPLFSRSMDTPSDFTGYESPNAYSHEYDQVLKKITEQSKASFDNGNSKTPPPFVASPLSLAEYANDVEERMQSTRTPDPKNLRHYNRRLSHLGHSSDHTDHDDDDEPTDV